MVSTFCPRLEMMMPIKSHERWYIHHTAHHHTLYIQSTTIDNVQVISEVEVKVKSFKIETELWIDFSPLKCQVGLCFWMRSKLRLFLLWGQILSALRSNYFCFEVKLFVICGQWLNWGRVEFEFSYNWGPVEVQLRSKWVQMSPNLSKWGLIEV